MRSLGADHVIDYTRADITDGDQRYDLVLDIGGNRSLAQFRRALTTQRHAGHRRRRRRRPLDRQEIHRQLAATILTIFVRQRLTTFIAKTNRSDLDTLRTLIEAGAITPAIERTVALDGIPDAIRDLSAGRVRGKIVIAEEPGSR